MSLLVLNCITNWIRDSPDAERFERTFESLREAVERVSDSVPVTGELKTIYVQYQFDCSGMPKAVTGIKVGRFSKKHQHLEIYVEVEPSVVAEEDGGYDLLRTRLTQGLVLAKQKLDGKVSNDIGTLMGAL